VSDFVVTVTAPFVGKRPAGDASWKADKFHGLAWFLPGPGTTIYHGGARMGAGSRSNRRDGSRNDHSGMRTAVCVHSKKGRAGRPAHSLVRHV